MSLLQERCMMTTLPRDAGAGRGSRHRICNPGIMPNDAPLDAAANGASIVLVDLPAMITGEVDPTLPTNWH
jgi:hypothetical protein